MNETTELLMRQFNSKKVHAETHEVGGGDEIDVTKLKNIEDYVTINGDFAGTWNGVEMTSVEPGLSSAFNALKADITTVRINALYPPSGLTALNSGDFITNLQAMCDYIKNNYNGGTIYIPSGTYNVVSLNSNGVNVYKNIRIVGSRKGNTILKLQGATAVPGIIFKVIEDEVIIEHLTLDGNKAAMTDATYQQSYGILTGNTANSIFRELITINFQGDGISCGGSYAWQSPQAVVTNLLVENCIFQNHYRNGISILGADGVTIRNCKFTGDYFTYPVDIESHNVNDVIKNVTVDNCRFVNTKATTYFGVAAQCTGMDDNGNRRFITVKNSTFDNCGVKIQGFSNVDLVDNRINSGALWIEHDLNKKHKVFTVKGNTIYPVSTSTAVEAIRITYSDYTTIVNNKVIGPSFKAGAYISECYYSIISANEFIDIGIPTSLANALNLFYKNLYLLVSGNKIIETRSGAARGMNRGMFIEPYSTIPHTITGNQVIGAIAGSIFVDTGEGVAHKIHGNVVDIAHAFEVGFPSMTCNDTLPAAQSAYRGIVALRKDTAGGVSDQAFVCRKRADGLYYWEQLTT